MLTRRECLFDLRTEQEDRRAAEVVHPHVKAVHATMAATYRAMAGKTPSNTNDCEA